MAATSIGTGGGNDVRFAAGSLPITLALNNFGTLLKGAAVGTAAPQTAVIEVSAQPLLDIVISGSDNVEVTQG